MIDLTVLTQLSSDLSTQLNAGLDQLSQIDPKQILASIEDYLPAIFTLSPVTMVGAGVAASATLLYLFTKAPEFLLVILTAIAYSAVPLLPRIS